jgi:hypothetical protein
MLAMLCVAEIGILNKLDAEIFDSFADGFFR